MKTNRRDFLLTSLGLALLPMVAPKPKMTKEQFEAMMFDFAQFYGDCGESEKADLLKSFNEKIAEWRNSERHKAADYFESFTDSLVLVHGNGTKIIH